MYKKLKYIILTIFILGTGFGVYSYLNISYIEFQTEFYPAIFLAGLIIIFYFLPRMLKMKNRILTLSALGIAIVFLLLTISMTLTHFSNKRYENVLTEYSELSCEEMKNRFETDLESDELKHFSGGIAGTGNLEKNLRKYNIEHFNLGCMVSGNLMCYSEFVSKYLKEKENVEINELWE
jgi:hypothetical protein